MENRKRLIYFHEGDIVQFKRPLENAPSEMMVMKIAKIVYNGAKEKDKVLLGVDVIWFDNNKSLQKTRLNTKDIEHTYDKV